MALLSPGATAPDFTVKALVDGVRRRKDAYPEIMDPIIKTIGEITRKAKASFADGKDLGTLLLTDDAGKHRRA